MSFADIVKGKKAQSLENDIRDLTRCEDKSSQQLRTVRLDMEEVKGNSEKLSNKIVGEVKCYSNLAIIPNLCALEGLNEEMVKYLGGLWVMFDTRKTEEEEKICASPEIQACFSSLQKWNKNKHFVQ
ncbi:hypothetical protein L2E82_50598 [Cichorium intybus]|nr:hypothetical protein L2E82_50598 [Cichorium intybus]